MALPEPIEPVTLTQEQMNKRTVIPFYTALPATTNVCLVSSKITHMFRVTKVEIHFRDDTANNLRVRAYVDDNANVNAANPPSGTNLIGKFSPTPYVIGQGQTIIVQCNYIPTFYETYIKAYFENLNAYAISGMVLVTIESITQEEAQELISGAGFRITASSPEDYFKQLDGKGKALYLQVMSGLQGTPEWMNTNDIMMGIITGKPKAEITKGADVLSIPFNFIKTDATDEEKAKAFAIWWSEASKLLALQLTSNAITDFASLGMVGFARDAWDMDNTKWQIPQNMGKVSNLSFDTAWLPALQRTANRVWLPARPEYNELINMVVKEKLSLEDFISHMKDKGFNENWSNLIWDSHFIAPDFETVRRALWRKGITKEEIPDFLKRVDLDPVYNDKVWFKLLEEIPPYTDLINMLVKEVITKEQFAEAIQTHGIYPYWAGKLWDAHFTPPSFIDFLTAMRRKQSVTIPKADGTNPTHTFGVNASNDISIVKDLAILADYDPRYWDFFKTRIYEDPTIRQARWGYESGDLTEEQVYDISLRSGLTPQDAKWFTQMQITFQERPFITRYLNGLMTAYINEAITKDELTKRVKAIPRREAVAEWIIKIADLQKEVSATKPTVEKEKLLSLSELKNMYWRGMIEETDFRTRLQLIGYETQDIQLLIDLLDKQKEEKESGAKKSSLSTSEMFNAFKWWQISETDLRTNLMLRGLTLSEANLLIETKKKQWISKENWKESETA